MNRIDEELAALTTMLPAQLREQWLALSGAPVPNISPGLMRLALAWELQARAGGGLSRITQQRLAQYERAQTRSIPAGSGMRLVREWNGKAHVVTIGEDQVIRWDGRSWNSLSEVARAITGTRWSGPAFFGLKRKVAA